MAVLRTELQNVQKIMVEDLGERKEKQLSDVRAENDALKIDLNNVQHENAKLSEKLSKLEEDQEDLKEKYFNADAQAESLKVELKQKQSNIDQLKQNLKDSNRNSDEQAERIGLLKAEIDALNYSSKESLNSAQSQSSAMHVQLNTLQTRLGVQDGKIKDLNRELVTIQTHYDEQVQLNDELKGQMAEMAGNVQETSRQKSNL